MIGIEIVKPRHGKRRKPPFTAARETMLEAARNAGKSSALDRLLLDYPRGPHDQPQSMCPAFGSLRVGLRMRRTATILSGSACCVYGLTFTSHFYGARRSVGYVPFNSESLVRGQLFEDIRKAVSRRPNQISTTAVVVINLCVPTASGVPLDLLPKEIDGVRIIGIDVPGFGVPTHAEAKDVLAGAMLRYARLEVEQGPVLPPRQMTGDQPTISLIGELFPGDPVGIGALLAPMGLPSARQFRRANGASSTRRSIASLRRQCTRSTSPRSANSGPPAAQSSAPRRSGSKARRTGSKQSAGGGRHSGKNRCRQSEAATAIRAAIAANPINARITVSGYEGSELLVARVLVEAGAEVPYVGTACPRTNGAKPIGMARSPRNARAVPRIARTGPGGDDEVEPDLAFGTTPLVQKAKERAHPRSISPTWSRRGRCLALPARRPRRDRRRTDKGRKPIFPHGLVFRRGRPGTPRATPEPAPADAG